MSITGTSRILTFLKKGAITLQGQFLNSSNYTFLVDVTHDGDTFVTVYKPRRGERPLWDFPPGTLAKREVAAYLVSEALGWNLVPPTIYRRQAPLGAGSLQLYIEHNPEYHYFNFSDEDKQRLQPAVVFDVLINNADRKGSHILVDAQKKLWLIDHGICFHSEDKLRTVLWDFAGKPIPQDLLDDLHHFDLQLQQGKPFLRQLLRLIQPEEVIALHRRANSLLNNGCFPFPNRAQRPYPWPPV